MGQPQNLSKTHLAKNNRITPVDKNTFAGIAGKNFRSTLTNKTGEGDTGRSSVKKRKFLREKKRKCDCCEKIYLSSVEFINSIKHGVQKCCRAAKGKLVECGRSTKENIENCVSGFMASIGFVDAEKIIKMKEKS